MLSAYGIGLADIRTTKVESVEMALTPEVMPRLESLLELLEARIETNSTEIVRKVNLKYAGTDSNLTVDFDSDLRVMQRDFATEHQTRYGFIQPEKELIIESITVELIQRMDTPEEKVITRTRPLKVLPKPLETVRMFTLDKWHDTKVYRREDLQPEDRITGAAIIVEPISTIIIEPNWQARVSDRNYLILERSRDE